MTIGQMLQWGSAALRQKDMESPELESEILLSFVLNCGRDQLFLRNSMHVSKALELKFKRAVAQRQARKPWQYITGEAEFYGLKIKVNKNVLIPRPETELLVEAVIKRFKPEWSTVLDIGAGSGAIPIALASNIPNARIWASEISSGAKALAARNAEFHRLSGRVKIIMADLFPVLKQKYDCIVSNPPYIPAGQLKLLQPEVSLYEPWQALDGGREGLKFYRIISKKLKSYLNPGGLLALEIGQGQGPKVREILKASNPGLKIEIIKDYSNIQRIALGYN
ncbi:peptide chain release factor N(5)-glutamine methyltransferase [candidate division TA06 bacterium]|uniref:Release factor glutamine methyltransferase n=1 Tax=candidate division TA06 bacterium TaxID=2250710 RepID=A0A933I970_UNCT6|nr:peptide chain release factor N(5)-glutamine methyltransferase [candidate division TA06 bacterium]